MVKDGSIAVKRRPGKLSLFSMGDRCAGVNISGAVYELTDGELTNAFPLGVSNEYREDEVTISVREGLLLVVQTGEE